MEKLIPTLLLALLCVLIFWLMWRGWQNRLKRQSSTGELPPVPQRYEEVDSVLAVPGLYVATTVMGDWLERIVTNTLGQKAKGTLFVFGDALVISRQGAQDLWIPARDIIAVRTEAGMNGKFVERDGLVVISWRLTGTEVDTGYRTRYAADKKALLQAISRVAPQALTHLPQPSNHS